MVRKIQSKDETQLQFFMNLIIPEHWKFLGDKNWDCGNGHFSYGKVYEVKRGVIWRICFYTPAHRGGICEKDTRVNPPKYSCILSNKQAPGVNEFIEHYGQIPSE